MPAGGGVPSSCSPSGAAGLGSAAASSGALWLRERRSIEAAAESQRETAAAWRARRGVDTPTPPAASPPSSASWSIAVQLEESESCATRWLSGMCIVGATGSDSEGRGTKTRAWSAGGSQDCERSFSRLSAVSGSVAALSGL
eukprot:1764265-Rhodomonas_salina.2